MPWNYKNVLRLLFIERVGRPHELTLEEISGQHFPKVQNYKDRHESDSLVWLEVMCFACPLKERQN